MSRKVKRGLGGALLVGVLGAGVGLFFFRENPRAQEVGAAGSGPFVKGAAIGRERAGFSGRPLVEVFYATDEEFQAVGARLAAKEVLVVMDAFTGVLVDLREEPREEARLRGLGFRVVVRELCGRVLGGLPGGWAAADLARLLGDLRPRVARRSLPSPVLGRLRQSAGVIDRLLDRGERARAEELVARLEEVDGTSSDAARAARARLAAR